MKIFYSTRSSFLEDIEDAIFRNRDTLLLGTPIRIRFSPQGYNGEVRVNIDRTNSATFGTAWEGSDPTRFPARIKAAASALYTQDCFGEYVISHETGILTIKYLGSIVNALRNNESRDSKELEIGNINLEKEKLLDILANIPWDAWQRIVVKEPEWQLMQPFLSRYSFGAFAVLMLVTGLNDYQLKGKADEAYWPALRALLERSRTPEAPHELCNLLRPFYQNERLPSNKIERLGRFLGSSFASDLWRCSAQKVSIEFLNFRYKLAEVMHQQPQDKTIVFAMKCLGLALLMAGEYQFDFGNIPIPVDSRVEKFTKRLGIDTDSPEKVRKFWNKIISSLKDKNTRITMIHLDSLVWQIASLNTYELQSYFRDLGIPQLGDRLASLTSLKGEVNSQTLMKHNSFLSSKNKNPDNVRDKVICFIPCCGSKYASGDIIRPERILSVKDLPNTWNDLLRGRQAMQYCIDQTSPKTSAIELYTGSPYNVFLPNKKEIVELIQSAKLRLIIISAGYGIVDALEPIQYYDAMMKGGVATNWRNSNLVNIIGDLLLQEQPAYVYGFFAGETHWSTAGSKYRYFFTEGVKNALRKGLDSKLTGCFYRKEGRGVKAILGSLGRTFIELMNSNFDVSYVNDVHERGRCDGDVKIGFQKLP